MKTVTVTTHHVISLEKLLNGVSEITTCLTDTIYIVQTRTTEMLSYTFTTKSKSRGKQKIYYLYLY